MDNVSDLIPDMHSRAANTHGAIAVGNSGAGRGGAEGGGKAGCSSPAARGPGAQTAGTPPLHREECKGAKVRMRTGGKQWDGLKDSSVRIDSRTAQKRTPSSASGERVARQRVGSSSQGAHGTSSSPGKRAPRPLRKLACACPGAVQLRPRGHHVHRPLVTVLILQQIPKPARVRLPCLRLLACTAVPRRRPSLPLKWSLICSGHLQQRL